MVKKVMLTTVDNPHSPFDDFAAWYAYDVQVGHHTSSFLARILVDSDQLSEADQRHAIELAIDEIVKENVNGRYRKVEREIEEEED
jgi:hypothetical protein